MDKMTLRQSLTNHPMIFEFIMLLASEGQYVIADGEYEGKKYVIFSSTSSKTILTFTKTENGYSLTKEDSGG